MDNKLGQRIKFFRKREGLSQLQLETAIEASPGMVSRIENGVVNPTKETLNKIERLFQLNMKEKLYFEGEWAELLDKEEVMKIIGNDTSNLFGNHGIGYLVDEKYRVWAASKALQKLLNLSDSELQKLVGGNLLRYIFDPNFPIYKFVHTNKFESMAVFELARFRKETPFWDVDPYCIDLIRSLKRFPEFVKAWEESQNKATDLYAAESKKVRFNFAGVGVDLEYTREFFNKDSRFILVSYFTTNKVLKLIQKYTL